MYVHACDIHVAQHICVTYTYNCIHDRSYRSYACICHNYTKYALFIIERGLEIQKYMK